MDTLWGEFLPVPQNQLKIPNDAEEIVIGNLRFLPVNTPGHAEHHYSYAFEDVCFSGDVSPLKLLLDPAELGDVDGQPLQELVGQTIALLRSQGRLPEDPIYGVRAEIDWRSLVITVASKLCMGQQRRNTVIASSAASEGTASRSIYQLLQHYRLAEHDPGDPADPIRYLGRSLQWEC